MRTDEFDFELPPDRIAQEPIEPRDRSRLMVVDRVRGTWSHHVFAELPELLKPGDVLVRNVSKVLPARLRGVREGTGGAWEGLYLRDEGGRWEILARTRGTPRSGERFVVGGSLALNLVEVRGGGRWLVEPSDRRPAVEVLEEAGEPPLPPYIRKGRAEARDRSRYQTVHAREAGSVAAPTAGLHFTEGLWRELEHRGVEVLDVTLHVGVGTFRPIEAESIDRHVMHAEWAELSEETAARLRRARREGRRVIAVGTTSARTLETAARTGEVEAFRGETAIYLRPGHEFRAVDSLITNFHLPRSSLFVLVCALAGSDPMKAAYAEAIRGGYRFYSYGDAMMIVGGGD